MNRYKHPVFRTTPTDEVEVAEHLTLADALNDAARRDAEGEPAVRYHAGEPGVGRDHARQH